LGSRICCGFDRIFANCAISKLQCSAERATGFAAARCCCECAR
jgi:hypothetical protein